MAGGGQIAVELAAADDQAGLVLVVVVIAVDGEHRVVARGDVFGRLDRVLGVLLARERRLQLGGIVHIDVGHEEAKARLVERVAPPVDGDLQAAVVVGIGLFNGLAVGLGPGQRAAADGAHQGEHAQQRKRLAKLVHQMLPFNI